jgi:hypothetical protein
VVRQYEQGRVDEAIRVTALASLDVLQNLCIADYARANSSRLSNGDTLPWEDVLSHFAKDAQLPSKLSELASCSYLYNPSSEGVTALLQRLASLQGSVRQPATPAKTRVLCDPVRWLVMLRVTLRQRKIRLRSLRDAVALWRKEHHGRQSARWEAFSQLQIEVEREDERLRSALERLPTVHVLTQLMLAAQRRHSTMVLHEFFQKRPNLRELQQKRPVIFDEHVLDGHSALRGLTQSQVASLERVLEKVGGAQRDARCVAGDAR